MAKRNSELPENVWEGARVLWENSSNLTDRELYERLKVIYGDDAPKSHTTIGRRRKKENWQRKFTLEDEKAPDEEIDAPKNAPNKKKTTNSRTKKPRKNAENDDNSSKNNRESEDAPSENSRTKNNAEIILWREVEEKVYNEARKVLLTQEQKNKKIFELQDLLNDGIVMAQSHNALTNRLAEVLGVDDEATKQVAVISESYGRNTGMYISNLESIMKMAFTVFGIKMQDFEISEQDRRMEGMKALDGIYEEAQRKRDELQQAMQKRLPEFENLTLDDAEFGESDYAAVYEDDEDEDDEDEF